MADMRPHSPEPPAGLPRIEHKPGLANEMLGELAPLLAEEGINVDNIDVADLETLQAAMNRAVERRNMELFSPVGQARDYAVTTLRLIAEAVADNDTQLPAAILDAVPPESPDGDSATVASCIGVALGLLDDWLCGRNWSGGGGVPGVVAGQAGEGVEHGDAVLGGGGGVGADGGEVLGSFEGAHGAGDFLSDLDHPDLLFGGVVGGGDGGVGGEA